MSRKRLPPICRETMSLDVSPQLQVILFPERRGQPAIDTVQLRLTSVEGRQQSIFFTPCEAMEVASALNTAVQFYLYNQEQYRAEVLEPRLENARERGKGRKNVVRSRR